MYTVYAESVASYRIRQNVRGGKFSWFSWFFTQSQMFPTNYGLVDCNVSLQACYHESFAANRNFVP